MEISVTVTYENFLHDEIIPAIRDLTRTCFQQDGAPLHYETNGWRFLNELEVAE